MYSRIRPRKIRNSHPYRYRRWSSGSHNRSCSRVPAFLPYLAVLMQRLAADGLRLVKPAEVEVVGGESTGLVDNVDQYGSTVVGQTFTRDRMTLQSVNQGLPRLVKAFLVLDCGTVHSSIVHNHGLDTTRRHHRTQASAACVT